MQTATDFRRPAAVLSALAVSVFGTLGLVPDRAHAATLQPSGSSAPAATDPGAGTSGSSGPSGMVPSLLGDTLVSLAAEATEAAVLLDVETESGSRQGSGFVVSPRGRIVTNHHVIEDARTIEVKLASGDVYERVKIMAVDERRDIAVLEIAAFDLPAIRLGNSDSVRVGTPVMAIGSPLGLENTVTTGIVSGRRSEPEGYELLQISAPASQGSSGGAVVSASGRAIGVAVSQMQDGQNLNFAVPINYVRGLLDHLDDEPLSVLSPESGRRGGERPAMSTDSTAVNRGLAFDLAGFDGYTVTLEGRYGDGRRRISRVTYRRIEALGGRPRIERYAETETTERTGPFGTPRTVRRTRSRAVVAAADLRPLSVRGEVTRWDGDRGTVEYDLRFEGYHVQGTVTDSTGRVRDIDRDLPPGTLLRSTRHLAFAALAEDSLVGRSVEFVTFDAPGAEMTSDRYDVLESTSVRVQGREHPALRVNVASGLSNSTVFFRRRPPRVLLRRRPPNGEPADAEVSEFELFGEEAAVSREDR